MFSTKRLLSILLAASLLAGIAACSDDDEVELPTDPEVPADTTKTFGVAVAVLTGPGSFDYTYYVIPAKDVMTGTISPVKNGVEQAGYTDFISVDGKVITFGGQGEIAIKSISQGDDGKLVLNSGRSVFDRSINGVVQADANTLLATAFSANPKTAGSNISYYTVDIKSNTVTKTVTASQPALSKLDWVGYGDMEVNGGKAFVSFYLNDYETFATAYTDTAYVGVYNYPAMTLDKVIKDVRTGPIGSFGTQCSLVKVENGDIYTVSSSNKGNGFSQKTKPGGILKIANGTTSFDANYFFAVEGISHIKYLGNNLAIAEVINLPYADQTIWIDQPLKTVIIDLKAKTVKDVSGIPAHAGNGARTFPALSHDGKAYLTIVESGATYIYQVDPATATATKGAKVEGAFVAGVFHF